MPHLDGIETATPRPGSTKPGHEPQRNLLYWWRVPERPGVGVAMLRITLIWFATLLAIVFVIGLIVQVG